MKYPADDNAATASVASPRQYNPPGQSALHYRVGGYQTFLEHMLDRVKEISVAIDGAPSRPLSGLNTAVEQDFATALFRAWAAACEVLAFYQERIVNEGFLRTATERASVIAIAREIGYELAPGASACTWLAFTIAKARGLPENITISTRTAVQGIGDAAPMPVTFETDREIDASSGWNELDLMVASVAPPAVVTSDMRQLRVTGVATGLRAGFPILIVSPAPDDGAADQPCYLGIIEAVERYPQNGFTLVRWDQQKLINPSGEIPETVVDPRIFVFRKQTPLFGASVPAWSALTDTARLQYGTRVGGVLSSTDQGRTWLPGITNQGLPPKDVRALAATASNTIFAATEEGVFRSSDGGETFKACTQGMSKRDILALCVGIGGILYAGGAGIVYRSTDSGETWEPLRGAVTVSRGWLGPKTTDLRLPATTVRALVEVTDRKHATLFLFAATDRGVFRLQLSGNTWIPGNRGLPGYDSKNGQCNLAIRCLAASQSGGQIFCGTDQGVFCSSNSGASWVAANKGLPFGAAAAVSAIALYEDAATGTSRVIAGTSKGVFVSIDAGRNWSPAGGVAAAVSALAISSDQSGRKTYCFAATAAGLYVSADLGSSWSSTSFTPNVRAVAIDPSGRVFAGVPFQGTVETDWPNFHVAANQIDLDQARGGIAPGSWAILHQGATGADAINAVCRVEGVSTSFRSDFMQRATVTRLEVAALPENERFNLRTTAAYVHSEQIAIYADQPPPAIPLAGSAIRVQGNVPNLAAERPVIISGKRSGVSLRANLGGVFQLRGVQLAARELVNQDLCALTIDGQGIVYVATPEDVFRRDEHGWTALNFAGSRVLALVANADGSLFVGSSDGVFQFLDRVWKSLDFPGKDVSAIAAGPGGEVYAHSVATGLMEFSAAHWTSISAGLPFESLSTIQIAKDDTVWVAAEAGVFKYANTTWSPTSRLTSPVLSLALGADGVAYAGTADGVFHLQGGGWMRIGLEHREISALALDGAGNVTAATRGDGLYYRPASGARWSRVALGVSNEIASMAIGRDGTLFAAARTRALAVPDDGLSRIEFTRGKVGSLDKTLADSLDACVISAALAKCLADLKIALAKDAMLIVVAKGSAWCVMTRDDPQSSLWAKYSIVMEGANLSIYENVLLQAMAMPVHLAAEPELQQWHLADQTGRRFTLLSRLGELEWESAPAWAEEAAELGCVVAVRGGNELILQDAIGIAFDPATTGAQGNVTSASHGESVQNEVLGSGRHSEPNQSFTLKKPPLTHLRSDTEGPVASTLKISITPGHPAPRARGGLLPSAASADWITWKEVPTLADSGPADRHYVVRIDDDGRAVVTFGDGVYGSRLPTGVENVVATYRSGTGTAGNIAAQRLTVLRRAPLGVRTVVNPLPGGGGADPDTIDDARAKVPISTRTLGRIVSLTDYEDFARTFAGIGHAQASMVWNGRTRILHLTIVPLDGNPIAPGDAEYDQLNAALHAFRALPHPIALDSYLPVRFDLAATLTIASDAEHDDVVAEVESTLRSCFALMRRDLGQKVTASEVIAVIQAVAGVTAVDVTELHVHGMRRELHQNLRARQAHWDARRKIIEPAQLLVLNSVALS